MRLYGRREGRRDGLLHGGCGGGGGGGWLGETTVAGEKERRDREGGKLVKLRIFMKKPSVLLFFFPLSLSRHGDSSAERHRGRRQVKAR